MDIVKGYHAVVLTPVRSEARHIRAAVRQSKKLWRVRKEQFRRQPIALTNAVINIRVELILTIGRNSGTRIATVSLRRGNQELTVRSFGVQESERYGINSCRQGS